TLGTASTADPASIELPTVSLIHSSRAGAQPHLTPVIERSPDSKTAPRAAGAVVFLCIPSGTPAANLLRTPVFSLIRDDPAVRKVVILSPYAGEARFRNELSHPKVDFAGLDAGEPGWLERRFIRI